MKLINIIAFPATIVLATLLMLSGLVPTVSPDTNSWLPLLGLAFPVLFLLMVLALIYWLIQLKWRSLFALSCLLLNLGQASLYIQWNDLEPDFVVDVTGYMETKLAAVFAYKSQFYDPNSKEPMTPISTENVKDSLSYRYKNLGRLIGTDFAEGFTSERYPAVSALTDLI